MITPKRSLAIGVTGGIGSGKSEVCAIFQSLGGKIISSDTFAKELMNTDQKIRRRIIKEFGEGMYKEDGTLDRKSMAKLIFSDESSKDTINAIVHPVVIEHIANAIDASRNSSSPKLLFIESALIYDIEIDEMFDFIILVLSDEDRRIDRVMKRDSVPKTEVMQRQSAQMPPEKFSDDADFVIDNNGDIAKLKTNCAFLYTILAQL